MARGGKRGGKKGGKRGARLRRAPGMLKGDCAQVTVNYGSLALVSNQAYGAYSFSLSNSARAKTVAQAYQYYRITKVIVKIKPRYDTFAGTGATSLSVPTVYWMIDRSYQFAGNTSVDVIKSVGAKPHRLDDKQLTFSFVPSITQMDISAPSGTPFPPSGGQTGPQIQAGKYTLRPWLPTNGNAFTSLGTATWVASTVDHCGFVIGIDQANVTATTTPVCDVEFVVEYEFKKRLWEAPPSDTRIKLINLDSMTLEDPPEPPAPLSVAS